jgi:hypothetical protein
VQREREDAGVAGEDRRGAVALVHVEVDDDDARPARRRARARRCAGVARRVGLHRAAATATSLKTQ